MFFFDKLSVATNVIQATQKNAFAIDPKAMEQWGNMVEKNIVSWLCALHAQDTLISGWWLHKAS